MMKQLALFSCLFLFGCSAPDPTPVEILESKILEHINKVAHDPSSYQPVSTEIVDTITALENLESLIDVFENNIASYLMQVERDSLKYIEWKNMGMMDELLEGKVESIELYRRMADRSRKRMTFLASISDSLMQSPDPNAAAAYYAVHTCRLNNQMGALNLKEYHIQVTDSLNIIKFEEDKGQLFVEPGGFPRKKEYDKFFRETSPSAE